LSDYQIRAKSRGGTKVKRSLTVVTAALVVLTSFQAEGKVRQTRPKVTALVCSVDVHGKPWVAVIGGPVAGKTWVDSEEAKGLMHEGDRLSLYALGADILGQVVLTSKGRLGSEEEDSFEEYGLFFDAQVNVAPGKQEAYMKAKEVAEKRILPHMLAVWSSKGFKPRWLVGEVLNPENRAYRRVIADWLARRGVPSDVIGKVVAEQVVRADIDGDKRNEVFLSFRSEDAPRWLQPGESKKRTFTYLLMRYLPPKSQHVKTIVIAYDQPGINVVAGFCDLDGDGRAEVITELNGVDVWGATLYRWLGSRFEEAGGWGGGA